MSIIEKELTEEMKNSFLDYSMSVIVSRALPDVRDGMKPVHRRILYAMNDLGMHSDKAYKKSARIVGEVIGKYHPHGDSAVYDTMVRMAQDFSYREMLVDGHGNFGSLDGDSAAAMRYTEARMSKISMEMMRDINKDTIDYVDNYDGSEREPEVLPARFPNLLVNGATGIAVGMATNIPPHNLGEVIDGVIALSHNPELTSLDLMEYVKGPDFPTAAMILGDEGIIKGYTTGNGSVIVRSRCEIEEHKKGRHRIIVKEIPYQVNKARLFEKIAELVRDKKIEGITELRDESNREGVRIVIGLHKDAQAEVVLNNLYKQTPLQTSFGMNMVALVNGVPKVLQLKEMLYHYLEHQKVVIRRRTQFELNKAEARAHILEGLKIALDNIDELIAIIRGSRDDSESKPKLIERFGLTEIQAQAILEMRLRRLSGLERGKIENELAELQVLISELKAILASEEKIVEIIRTELLEVKERFATPRKTEIGASETVSLSDESMIQRSEIVVFLTKLGYIKRMPLDAFKNQNRGGKGGQLFPLVDGDTIEEVIQMNSHQYLIFFTNKGKAYHIKGYQIPETKTKGLPVINLINLEYGDNVATISHTEKYASGEYFNILTSKGSLKRIELSNFRSIPKKGVSAINLESDETVAQVQITSGEDTLLMATTGGLTLHCEENKIRSSGRGSGTVKGIVISEDDKACSLSKASGNTVVTLSQKGFGKRTPLSQYRVQTRGGRGIQGMKVTSKTGELVKSLIAEESDDILVVTALGKTIRLAVTEFTELTNRITSGAKLMDIAENDSVKTLEIIKKA